VVACLVGCINALSMRARRPPCPRDVYILFSWFWNARMSCIWSWPQYHQDAGQYLDLLSWNTALSQPNRRTSYVSMVNQLILWNPPLTRMTGRPTDMGTKFIHHSLWSIARRMHSITYPVFAPRFILMSRLQFFNELQGYVQENTSPNARPALAAICISWLPQH
jgi:hypothetical protein